MNVELLRKIQAAVIQEPKRLYMDKWIMIEGDAAEPGDMAEIIEYPACGTVGCIAGWAVILNDQKGNSVKNTARKFLAGIFLRTSQLAKEALDLEHDAAGRLFYVHYWPTKYAQDYSHTQDPVEKAKVAVARIEHFIATEGKE